MEGEGVLQRLKRVCFSVGDETALTIRHGDGTLEEIGFSEVSEWSADIANQLQGRLGVKRGDRVLLVLKDGEHAGAQLCAVLACLRAGALWVPAVAWTRADKERLQHVVAQCDPHAAIVVGDSDKSPDVVMLADEIGIHRMVLVQPDGALTFQESMLALPELHSTEDDPSDDEYTEESRTAAAEQRAAADAYLQFTSGSTNLAKAVVGTMRGLENRLNWALESFPFQRGELCLRRTPLGFVDAIAEMLVPLVAGVPTWASSEPQDRFDIVSLVQRASAAGVSRLTVIPSQLELVLRAIPVWEALRIVFVSGEAVQPSLIKLFQEEWAPSGVRLISLYGSTEVAADATFVDLTNWSAEPAQVLVDDVLRTKHPIGAPISNCQVRINAPENQQLGELVISGAPLGRYFDLSALQHSENGSAKGSNMGVGFCGPDYYTGDLGFKDESGALYWVGRKDNQVKIRGIRIELEQAESQIAMALKVPREQVALHCDSAGRLVLFSEPDLGNRVIQTLVGRILDAHIPHSVVCLGKPLPKTSSGKLDRKALKGVLEVTTTQASADLCESHASPVVDCVVKALSASTASQIDWNMSFRGLGGDSMLAVQLCLELKHVTKEPTPLPVDLMDESTPLGSFFGLATCPESDASKRFKSMEAAELKPSRKVVPQAIWEYEMQRCVDASPLIHEGYTFAASHSGHIAKLESGPGTPVWQTSVRGQIHASPTFDRARQVLYVTSYDDEGSYITAVGVRDGNVIQQVASCEHQTMAASTLSGANELWLACMGSLVLVVNLGDKSKIRQITSVQGDIWADVLGLAPAENSSPVASVVASQEGHVAAFDAKGEKVWSHETEAVYGAMASGELDGETVFVHGTAACSVRCVAAANGEEKWVQYCGGPVMGAVRVQDGLVLVGCHDKIARCLQLKDGSIVWETALDAAIVAQPALGPASAAFATTSGSVYWLDKSTGETLDIARLPGEIRSGPQFVDKSDIIIGCRDNLVRRLRAGQSVAPA